MKAKHPVELLRDGRGVYGIVGRCLGYNDQPRVEKLILRPGRVDETNCDLAALQKIKLRGPFRDMVEEDFREIIFRGMCERAGLQHGLCHGHWGSDDPAEQKRNRQKYHGLKRCSLLTINYLINEALAVADQDALKQARRFPLHARMAIYRYALTSQRAAQVIEAFSGRGLCNQLRPQQ
jgi:hypothetical protein